MREAGARIGTDLYFDYGIPFELRPGLRLVLEIDPPGLGWIPQGKGVRLHAEIMSSYGADIVQVSSSRRVR